MKPVDKKIILYSLKVMVLMSLAFLVISLAPQHAHHLVLVISVILLVGGAGPLLRYRELRNWSEARARITRIGEREEEVAISKVSRLRYFYPEIEYEYTVDGVTRSGDVVAFEKENVWIPEFSDWGDPIPAEKRWWTALEPGAELPVYVNPRNPGEAVLIREPAKKRRSHHLALALGGILLALVWLVLAAGRPL